MGKNKKLFWDERSKKLQNKNRKKKKIKQQRTYIKTDQRDNQFIPDQIVEVPECFSFVKNREETVEFFNKMLQTMDRSSWKSEFMIESKNVKDVSTDAIMYLIAIMRNYKIAKKRMFSFYGSYPLNAEARKVYIESGLLKFVQSKSKNLPKNNKKISIRSGRTNDSSVAGEICKFVAENLEVSKMYVKDLYEVIIEMMSNVYYHAYNDDEVMVPEWYMYAEHREKEVKFMFLDTGVGIGKTVRKHSLYEKVVSRIGIASESRLIKSALDGDFRTQTGKDNHGRGLPYINEFALNQRIKEFHIVSGKGHCWINGSDIILVIRI